MNNLKKAFNKAEAELIADGWTNVLSVMHDGKGVDYGTLFTKEGSRFYLNKDTLLPGFTGPAMAKVCAPLFN